MRKFVLLIILLLPFFNVKAQESISNNCKNSIQFNPIDAFLFTNFELAYERAITSNMTVSLGLGVKPSGGLLTIKGFDSPTIKTNDFAFKGFVITPEYRWYFQKQSSSRTGFYLGAYYRFKNYNNNFKGIYTSSNTKTSAPLDFGLNMKMHTLGLMLGYKTMFNKHLYLDILIGGPGYTVAKINIEEHQPLPDEFFIDAAKTVIDNYESVYGLIKKIDLEELAKILEGDIKFGLPAFRYGFKIGYSF